MVRPCSCGPAGPNFPRCGGVKRLVDASAVDRVVRLGRHESEPVAAVVPVVRRVFGGGSRCSALESFAGGRAALPVYHHNGRMCGAQEGKSHRCVSDFWIGAAGERRVAGMTEV